ncbi:component of the polarisome [Clarireedia jacksonii]
MNNRNGPLSPVSIDENEWLGYNKYNDDSPYQTSRGQLASPPVSSSSNGTMNGGGFPPRGSSGGSPGNPSPPSSVGRSSIGTGLYAGSESGQGKKDEQFEGVLSEHYVALKRYLAASLRDEKGNPRPNRARDKLLRLSPVQFQELSTDVFDELLRRQQAGRRTPNGQRNDQQGGPPPYLLPKDTFHPKRNQARQKLSTLPPPRFRDLATDVFYELERRFPKFVAGDINRIGSPASIRSRNGNGPSGDLPPRGPSRMRRPSDASSIAYSARSESRNGPRMPPNGNLVIPPSPGIPPNDYGRPTPKTFQSNTIVPNKSTMVEDESGAEDNDDDDNDAFGLEGATRQRESKKSDRSSDTNQKLIDDYQSQVAELREKLDSMEDELKRKDDELQNALNAQRGNGASLDSERREWADLRINLENKLADAQNLNDDLQSELERVRASQANSERELRSRLTELQTVGSNRGVGTNNPDLERENEELRAELREQQEITEEVRNEAREFLREMRMLSERSGASYNREAELESMVNKLEEEVNDWRNRYAKAKTQLRSLRANSMGLTIQDAAKYAQESGFTQEDGLIKDVHVTKFQISINELLQTARSNDPTKVIDHMKNIIVNVRRISQDIDEAPKSTGELAQKQSKLKAKLSATANNLITASRNFAGAKGLSPVSILDAAASHLTSTVVELVRMVKVRPTPAGELEEEEEVKLAPVEAPKSLPVREIKQEPTPQKEAPVIQPENIKPAEDASREIVESPRQSTDEHERPGSGSARQSMESSRASLDGYVPGPFLGLRNGHTSTDSSMYSPINSPRESMRPKSSGKDSLNGARPSSRGDPIGNGISIPNINPIENSMPSPLASNPVPSSLSIGGGKSVPLLLQAPRGPPSGPPSPAPLTPPPPPAPMTVGFGLRSQESDVEELKMYLEDQTALLVQNIQSLVASIRSDGGINAISNGIDAIANVVGDVVAATEDVMNSNTALRSQSQPVLQKLSACRERILDAGYKGRMIANEGRDDDEGDAEWRAWNQSLPPIAFEIARETKELVLRVDVLDGEGAIGGDDDFS